MKPYDDRIEPTVEVTVGPLTSSGRDAVIGRVEVEVPAPDLPSGVRRAMAWTAAADQTTRQVVNVIDRSPTRYDVRVLLKGDTSS